MGWEKKNEKKKKEKKEEWRKEERLGEEEYNIGREKLYSLFCLGLEIF